MHIDNQRKAPGVHQSFILQALARSRSLPSTPCSNSLLTQDLDETHLLVAEEAYPFILEEVGKWQVSQQLSTYSSWRTHLIVR